MKRTDNRRRARVEIRVETSTPWTKELAYVRIKKLSIIAENELDPPTLVSTVLLLI